jgi:hypothetical protein
MSVTTFKSVTCKTSTNEINNKQLLHQRIPMNHIGIISLLYQKRLIKSR